MSDERNMLIWAEAGQGASTLTCPVCLERAEMPPVVSVANPWQPGGTLAFHRCPACGSISAPRGHFVEFTDGDPGYTLAWRHYVQLGAGIDAMVRPIERMVRTGERAPRTLLDVGCGFGFVVDFWRHAEGAAAAGVEPSEFGRRGRELLTGDVHVGMLDAVAELAGCRFDIVLSAEVIEHVPEPKAFVAELKARLLPGGTLILTTPNADFIARGSPLAAMLGVLSPGLHKAILSEAALRALLLQAGFANVVVTTATERLLAWASDAPIELHAAGQTDRDRVTAYLVQRAGQPELNHDLVLGFAYRALRELVNEGRIAEAAPMLQVFRTATLAAYGIDIADAEAVRKAVLPVTDMAGYERAAPFSLGCAVYFAAMVALHGHATGLASQAGFQLAFELMVHTLRMAPEYFQEAETLVWAARFESGCAARREGRLDVALAEFRPLLLDNEALAAALCSVRVPDGFALRATAESASCNLDHGQFAAAMTQAAAFLSHPGASPEQAQAVQGVLRRASEHGAVRAEAAPEPLGRPTWRSRFVPRPLRSLYRRMR